MGTVFSFRVPLDGLAMSTDELAGLVTDACRLLHRHDELLSPWRPDSALSALRAGTVTRHAAPPELREVLDRCLEARDLSGGWFDPWAMPGGVDPTGLAKGWSAQQALALLRRGGVADALLNAGGDVVATGHPAPGRRWSVGIRHPWRPDALACTIWLDAAVATSGTYERGPHLVDPRTGRPGTRAASASVTGADLGLVDALATALAVGGDETFERITAPGTVDAYLVRADGSERWTEGFPFAD